MKSCLALLAVAAVLGLGQANYCNMAACNGKDHIGCNNSGAFGPQCTADAEVEPMTSALKNQIVSKHNELRNKVAAGGFNGLSPAARMATMEWDDELAQLAEMNVKQCAISHDACRATSAFNYAGQNLAFSSWVGTEQLVSDVVDQHMNMWFNEYKDCPQTYIDNYRSHEQGKVIGHFTQLVQQKATHVGCATLRQTKDGWINQFTACNYAMTNFLNRPVYTKSSTAASQCTTGVNPSYTSLCSVNEKIDPNTP